MTDLLNALADSIEKTRMDRRCNHVLRGYYGDEVLCTRPPSHEGDCRSDTINDRNFWDGSDG